MRMSGFVSIVRRMVPLMLFALCALPAAAQDSAAQQQRLTERVDQLYQLFVSGDWSQVDGFITEDSRNIWLTQVKNTIEAFEIQEVAVAPEGDTALVTVLIDFRVAQVPGAPFRQPQRTEWVRQDGEWLVRLRPPASPMVLFDRANGALQPAAPQPNDPQDAFRFDRNSIFIPRTEAGAETVLEIPFENVTPDVVTLQRLRANCVCLQAAVDATEIQPGGKGVLTLTYRPSAENVSRRLLRVFADLTPSTYVLNLPVGISR